MYKSTEVKRHIKKRIKITGEVGSLPYYAGLYIEMGLSFGHAYSTTQGHQKRLKQFLNWCLDRELELPSEVTFTHLAAYQRYLSLKGSVEGHRLSASSIRGYIQTLKHFFSWMYRERHILSNPSSDLVYPRSNRTLPRDILTESEVNQVLRSVDLKHPRHLRDRAMMELFYSCGVRRMELVNLKLKDVDLKENILFVDQGKGGRDRYLPVGERAVYWIERYLKEVRPRVVWGKDEGNLFLNMNGESLSPGYVTHLMRRHVKASGVNKKGACHIFRHTMATQMLDHGADVRFIQSMLGHASLRNTAIYTHVALHKLKEVHEKTHPGSKNHKKS